MSIKSEVKKLRSSALFNISLGSRETFHSDFLYWFINRYNKDYSKLFLKEILNVEVEIDEIQNIRAMREVPFENKKFLDLVIYYNLKDSKKDYSILIENKIKDFPDEIHLDRYSNGNVRFDKYLLLSLIEPDFFTNGTYLSNESTWYFKNYMSLALFFGKVKDEKNQYDNYLIEDYILFITSLHNIISNIKLDNGYEYLYEINKDAKLLKDIRLGDIYRKYKYCMFTRKIKEELITRTNNKIYFSPNWEQGDIGDIFVNTAVSNKSKNPLCDVKYVIFKDKSNLPICLGVQIEQDNYRLFVESKNPENVSIISNNLFDSQQWFDFRVPPSTKIYPVRKVKHNNFKAFKESFLYQEIKIKEMSIDDLLEMIIKNVYDISKIDIEYINKAIIKGF